jgi:hypothetical protein
MATPLTLASGNLSTRSLASIVSPSSMVQDSEFLETHLIAVPNAGTREYLKSYESLSPMVVPRSSVQLASDDEFTLFAVTSFKMHSAEFVHKARERRWTPRDFKFVAGGRESEAREMEALGREEKKVWGEALRLGRTGYSEAAMVWVHVMALRVFVETVLRYGLPLDFVSGIVQVRTSAVGWAVADVTDDGEAGQEGCDQPRRELLVPGGQCAGTRQERPRQEGRPRHGGRNAGGGRWWRGVHCVRVLRIRIGMILML